MSKIFIASDHAGFELKQKVKDHFLNLDWLDLGTDTAERVDYPDYASKMASELSANPKAKGVLICGSGQGMAMRANKYPHIRAALCFNLESATLSREHNDANVLCLGQRQTKPELALEMIKLFLKTEFSGGRHQARVNKISDPVS